MNRKTIALVAGVTLALAGLLVWAFAPRPVQVEVAQATVGSFETSVDEDARTRLRDRFVVSAPLAGRLQRIALREGDSVQAGAVLAQLAPVLSPMLDDRTIREQQARIGAAEGSVQRAATRIESSRLALDQARKDLRRTEQLAQQGFVSPTKIDTDRLAVQAAQKDLDTSIESEHITRHELEQARAALVAVRGAVAGVRPGEAFTVRAPVAGRILKVVQTSETTVPLGTALIEIGDIGNLEVVAELLTTDALIARPGSLVRIERWGGPVVLQGQVRRIEPAAFTKVSALGVEEQRVNVLIDITSPRPEWAALGDGFRVGVRIITRSEPAALRVPVSAVFPLKQGDGVARAESAVFVLDNGRARLLRVKVAARNGSEAWIRDGLAAGATVIVYPPATVADGTKVKARGV